MPIFTYNKITNDMQALQHELLDFNFDIFSMELDTAAAAQDAMNQSNN